VADGEDGEMKKFLKLLITEIFGSSDASSGSAIEKLPDEIVPLVDAGQQAISNEKLLAQVAAADKYRQWEIEWSALEEEQRALLPEAARSFFKTNRPELDKHLVGEALEEWVNQHKMVRAGSTYGRLTIPGCEVVEVGFTLKFESKAYQYQIDSYRIAYEFGSEWRDDLAVILAEARNARLKAGKKGTNGQDK
jgi:hypothetical protein